MHAYLTVKKQGDILVAQRSKSFLIAFCGLMIRQWCQDSDTLDDTGGNSHALDEGTSIFCCVGQGGYGLVSKESTTASDYMESDRLGIVIGSGTSTVVPDDNALQTQIRSGEKSNTILYCGTSVYGLTTDSGADTGSFKILGLFHNVSGGSIDVKEVGVYAGGDCGVQSHPNVFGYCIIRDNISTVALADEEFLEVEYTISIAT
jgi:hypothetical protein